MIDDTPPTTAHDFVVAESDEVAARADRDSVLLAGWAGVEGPAIEVWPRSPRTAQPMVHCFTSWLPGQYRRREAERVGISVFRWADRSSHRRSATPVDPCTGIVGDKRTRSYYAVAWLTEAELTGARTARPDSTGETDWPERGATPNDTARRPGPLWLVPRAVPRDDPDTGRAPDGRQQSGSEHLGGPVTNPDGPRMILSPWYLELSGLVGLDDTAALYLDLDAPSLLGRPPMVDVLFHELAEWESARHSGGVTGYRRKLALSLAFDGRLVSIGEQDGPSWNGGAYPPGNALWSFPHFFEDDESAWLRPFVRRLAMHQNPASVRADALAAYAERHDGAAPPTHVWPLSEEHYG